MRTRVTTLASLALGLGLAGQPFTASAGAVNPFSSSVLSGIQKTAAVLGTKAAMAAFEPMVYAYILAQRAAFGGAGTPLTAAEKTALARHFPARLLDSVRVVERGDTGMLNYWAGATTYGTDLIIVRTGQRTTSLLKHELVHVCQYDRYGVQGFSYRYADQFILGGFSYNKILFETQAYGFGSNTGAIASHLGYCR